ncbi:hypothetical protein ACHAXR_012945 [Thalassiosira sp. AJA248-18]
MLTKCMLNPLKLARLTEWNGRLGKPSAIMAIDITNHQIGIALAYHRQQSLPNDASYKNRDGTESAHKGNDMSNNNASISTSLTALPPIPYMSRDPYHPSYAFLHHHRHEDGMRNLDRVQRTVEVADQLAQLAHERKVKGILVRWPGDLASAVSSGRTNEESMREVEEDESLFPAEPNRRNGGGAGVRNAKSDGSMGYMRGRILYLLDKCCTSHGHDKEHVSSEPLLMEGSRPFVLWDTSRSEQNWISYQQRNKHSKHARPMIPKRQDKYGNSLTEMDPWGRAAVFGNQPPEPMHGRFYYSSKQQYFGYRVSSQFGVAGEGRGAPSAHLRNENFDSLHDNESRMSQFQGSLSALHALYDFAKENLQGRITLPLWTSRSPSASSGDTGREQDDKLFGDGNLGYRNRLDLTEDTSAFLTSSPTPKKSTLVDTSNGNSKNNIRVGTTNSAIPNKKPNGLATLAQMPTRKRRRGKGKVGSQ